MGSRTVMVRNDHTGLRPDLEGSRRRLWASAVPTKRGRPKARIKIDEKRCDWCDEVFIQTTKAQRFCSYRCRRAEETYR